MEHLKETQLFKDIFPGSVSSVITEPIIYKNRLYFGASMNNTLRGPLGK